jgi:hypothetical protein
MKAQGKASERNELAAALGRQTRTTDLALKGRNTDARDDEDFALSGLTN